MWNKASYCRKAIKRRLPLLFTDMLTLSGAGLSCKNRVTDSSHFQLFIQKSPSSPALSPEK